MAIHFGKLRSEAEVRKPLVLALTDAEYRTLVRVISVGGSMYSVMGDMVDDDYKPVGADADRLESMILSHAKEFGMGDAIEWFEERVVLKDDQLLEMTDDLLAFEEFSMWDGAANFLAKRDLQRRHGNTAWAQLGDMERISALCEAEEVWAEEFTKHGFDRLEIVT